MGIYQPVVRDSAHLAATKSGTPVGAPHRGENSVLKKPACLPGAHFHLIYPRRVIICFAVLIHLEGNVELVNAGIVWSETLVEVALLPVKSHGYKLRLIARGALEFEYDMVPCVSRRSDTGDAGPHPMTRDAIEHIPIFVVLDVALCSENVAQSANGLIHIKLKSL